MADTSAPDHAPAKQTVSARRAMGLRQLAESLDDESLPLSGYACGCCATLLPVGVDDCPTCHTPVTTTTPVPNHPAGRRTGADQLIVLDDSAAAVERTRDIRRSWLRRPDRQSDEG